MEELMPTLPEEMIAEILVRSSVKSLLRFRCVSKSWCNLIKSPDFIQRHLKHNSTKKDKILAINVLEDNTYTMSIHYDDTLDIITSLPMEIPEFDYWSLTFFDDCKFCWPCNGILCVSADENDIYLFNPAMRECKMVPPLLCPEGWREIFRGIGFGFDSIKNDYKVISFVDLIQSIEGNEDEAYISKTEIYNLSTNSWREIEHNSDLSYRIAATSIVPFNGALHWIARKEGNDSYNILSFDINIEVFGDMELPIDPWVNREKWNDLMVLNESLALFACSDTTSSEWLIDLWVMQEYGKARSWTKQVRVGPLTGIRRPLMFWKDKAVLLENNQGRVVSCALDTHEMNDVGIHSRMEALQLMTYYESLISIK